MKVHLAGSRGGSFTYLRMFELIYMYRDRSRIVFNEEDTRSHFEDEHFDSHFYTTSRSLKSLIRNTIPVRKILRKEKSNPITSNGTGVALHSSLMHEITYTRNLSCHHYMKKERGGVRVLPFMCSSDNIYVIHEGISMFKKFNGYERGLRISCRRRVEFYSKIFENYFKIKGFSLKEIGCLCKSNIWMTSLGWVYYREINILEFVIPSLSYLYLMAYILV